MQYDPSAHAIALAAAEKAATDYFTKHGEIPDEETMVILCGQTPGKLPGLNLSLLKHAFRKLAESATPKIALSVRQPWAWLIFNGKDVENRTWSPRRTGDIWIHASLTYDPSGDDKAKSFGIEVPPDLPMGGLVGIVNIAGCSRNNPSRWAQPDQFHWGLKDQRATEFRPLRGQRGLFPVD